MKSLLALLLLVLLNDCAYTQKTPDTGADSILVAVFQKLNSLKSIRYEHSRELNYSSENYHNQTRWNVYCDFQSTDTVLGIKYQIDEPMYRQIFNGTEKFDLDKTTKTFELNDHPGKESFSSLSAFYNSIVTLHNILPAIISDKSAIKSVVDTMVNDKPYHLITFNIGKRRIKNLGNGFDVMRTKNNFIYKILIDKADNLPYEILQVNDVNNDFIRTNFTRLEINAGPPSDLSWYYSTYINEYKPVSVKSDVQLLQTGSMAPNWSLNSYNKNEMVSLNGLKGKVILLDFWIKNCGPCIQSVSHLNSLKEKFKARNVEIVSINSYDTRDEISWFCNQHKTSYKVLVNGREIAEKYGVVNGFPAFFIIDQTGQIIYSHLGFDESVHSTVEKIIESAL